MQTLGTQQHVSDVSSVISFQQTPRRLAAAALEKHPRKLDSFTIYPILPMAKNSIAIGMLDPVNEKKRCWVIVDSLARFSVECHRVSSVHILGTESQYAQYRNQDNPLFGNRPRNDGDVGIQKCTSRSSRRSFLSVAAEKGFWLYFFCDVLPDRNDIVFCTLERFLLSHVKYDLFQRGVFFSFRSSAHLWNFLLALVRSLHTKQRLKPQHIEGERIR